MQSQLTTKTPGHAMDAESSVPESQVSHETAGRTEALPFFAKDARIGALKVKSGIRAGKIHSVEEEKK
ncbi:hypothetical protein [uncultured Thiodictyon sp.]|uniref:hypothetical protein n=1 Tax=uncultured Thiodictyon sp. TaxID=1846217 RepID=UPI0025D73C1A|nr:hypothetical protein [uncultured Thiodictyon sp.]